jgi:1-acyl-sn-glycerol-3-phosphate acyltransferase
LTLYDAIATLLRPVAWWGRLRTDGLEIVPEQGPVLVVPNHDSQWDPVLVGLAVRPRRRLRFLARASLWGIPGLGPVLDRMHQIPIRRGVGDAAALDHGVEALRSGVPGGANRPLCGGRHDHLRTVPAAPTRERSVLRA